MSEADPKNLSIHELNPWMLPDDLSYEDWVLHIFDHPVLEPKWWSHEVESQYYEYWNEQTNPALTLSYLTRLFLNSRELVTRFDRMQIDQGLTFLVSNACSNYMYVLTNQELPWDDRRACLDAMIPLYRDLMLPVYGYDPSVTWDDVEVPYFACFMWWDVIPLHGGMDHPDRDRISEAVLNIFEQVIQIKDEACMESVIHGLGHWHHYFPERITHVINRFLAENTWISLNLLGYAKNAAVGNIP